MLIPVLLLAVAATACTNDGESTSGVASLETDTTSEPISAASDQHDAEEAMIAFAQCLRDNGIDVDDPVVDADGNPQLPPIEFEFEAEVEPGEEPGDFSLPENQAAAFAECEPLLEGIVMTGTGSGTETEFEDAFLEYAQCMRDQGIDMPDPEFDDGIIVMGGGDTDMQDIDEFDAAHDTCKGLFSDLGIEFGDI